MADNVPTYLASAQPNPMSKRAAWFKTIAQAYAGIFLWIAFFDTIAGNEFFPGSLAQGGIATALVALVAAGIISVVFFYYVPGVLGMKTGLPLYVVGSSTFGTKGGIAIPGFFMGILQIGWYSVATYYAALLILSGIGMGDYAKSLFGVGGEFNAVFVIVTVVWGYLFAFLGAKGLKYVAAVSTFFPIAIIVLLLIGVFSGMANISKYDSSPSLAAKQLLDNAKKTAKTTAAAAGKTEKEAEEAGMEAMKALAAQKADQAMLDTAKAPAPSALVGFCLIINVFIGFFATAGAAGADFCTAARNKKDVWMGGFVGVALVGLFAGGMAILTVAAAQATLADKIGDGTTLGNLVNYKYFAALPTVNESLGNYLMIILAIGSVAPACFCSFIIGNSLSTMLGKPNSRVPITMAGVSIGIILAATGIASQLEAFFGLIGASFGPVLGAMMADYLLSGCKWAGPRKGISVPGYAAWLLGFLVGISTNPLVTNLLGKELLPGWHPAAIYSFVVGFIVYAVLAKAGMEGEVVEVDNLKLPAGEGEAPSVPVDVE